jgi:hypothetical protein
MTAKVVSAKPIVCSESILLGMDVMLEDEILPKV